jgi:putative DNA primase/helicase
MIERYRDALQFIPSEDRATWVQCGMALKHEFGDLAFDVWDQWSMAANNYNGEVARQQWKSFKYAGAVTVGTLFKYAYENGYRDDGKHRKPTHEEIAERNRIAGLRLDAEEKRKAEAQSVAAHKARWILSQCEIGQFAYMDSHGMPNERVQVWRRDGFSPVMVVPMNFRGEVCGVQLIWEDGAKKFLKGQKCENAEFTIGRGNTHIWTEGFCTGMAVFKAVAALKINCSVHVCFSDCNMVKMAHSGFVVADNDVSLAGENAAKEIGLPYWLSPVVGDDFCDFLQKNRLLAASQSLRKILYTR